MNVLDVRERALVRRAGQTQRLRRVQLSPDLTACLLFAALVLIFFAPAATLQGVFYFGDASHHLARLAYSAERLRAGELGLWNPYLSLGGSHAGDPAALAWYPINLLLALLLPIHAAYNYVVLVHVLLAALAMYLLARAWQQTSAGALLAGVVYAFSGFAVAHLQHLNILIALAWLPLIFYYAESLLVTARVQYLALAGIALALQILGGHTQIVLYGALALAAYIALELLIMWRAGQRRAAARVAFGMIGAFALALGLAAVYIVPFVELWDFIGHTGDVSWKRATTFSLLPERLITFLFPFWFGGSVWRAEVGRDSLLELTGYVGILPLALAPFALTHPARRRAIFLLVLTVGALLLALGRYAPAYALVYPLPVIGTVRAPARWLALVTFGFALLAGFGLDALRGHAADAVRRRVGVAIVALLVALVPATLLAGASAAFGAPTLQDPATLAALVTILSAAGVIALWVRRMGSKRMRLVLTVAVVAADLFFFSASLWYNRVAPLTIYTQLASTAQPIVQDSEQPRLLYWGNRFRTRLKQGKLESYVQVTRGALGGSLPMQFEVRALHGYLREAPPYRNLFRTINKEKDFGALGARVAAMFGARYVLTQRQLDAPELQLVAQADGVNLYRYPDVQPRAFIVSQARALASPRAALNAIKRGDFDPRRTVLLDAPAPELNEVVTPSARAVIQVDESERVVLHSQSDAPGYLVLSDTFYPGWRATVDGFPAPIYRANALVRAVPIGAGSHRVELVYDPLSVKIGAAISGGTSLLLLALVAMRWRTFRSFRR